ncbi:hypothetical protein D3C87_903130 [compost metagenome]
MKRLALLAMASTILATGCGQRSFVATTVPGFNSQPALVTEAAAPEVKGKTPAPSAPVVLETPLARLEADLRTVAMHGAVVQDLDTLGANIDEESAYGVMATPDATQGKAVKTAQEWASDAEQLYLGWGFKWLTFVGHSRHVFWSPRKKKLLTLDYGFWGTLKDRTETENLAMTYGGALIRQLLREPNYNYAFDGKAAFQRAKKAGLEAPSQGAIKAILLDIYFLGPIWVFFDYRNNPAMLVDANDGRTISDSYVLDILKYLF